MAEPFGIASLSIEACKALVSYCDGWRAFDTEIDSVRMKAEGLLSTLQILDKLLGETSAVRPIITADIALKMSQTGSRIADVCQKVTKCSVIPNSSGVDQKLRKTAKKAKYPFRRDTLKSAANDLQDIQINLNTAFLALQIQQAQSLRKVEVQGASIITTVDQLQSSLDKMQIVVQGRPIPSDSQLQIASKYPAQCRRASHKYRNNETTRRVRFVSGWLRMSIELMMTIENGTQGFALSPVLRFRGIVPENSPAFNLIGNLIGNLSYGYSTPQQNEEISNRAIRSLQQMFDEGRARPGDQTQEGDTLMTTLSFQIFYFLISSSYTGFLPYYPILRYLVSAGCPIENVGNSQDFLYHIVFRFLYCRGRNISTFVTKLTGIGFQITDTDLSGIDVGSCRYAFIHSQESFMISDVTHAILSRSETELKRLIASGKVSSDDHRLCHMCSSWAPGLGILLEFMPAVDPYELALLLETAVKHGCLDSVKILIDHGSPIINSTIWVCDSKETKGIVFDAFIARRKHLLQLARTMLPEYSQEELRLERGLLPDSNAGEIHAQLKRHNIFVPSFLRPYIYAWDRDVSVFHGLTLSVDDMVLLYTAGFHDIDALNSEGYTPISRENLEFMNKQSIGEYIERLKWFMSKGAKLHSPPTITGSVPSHHISRNITYFLLKPLQAALKSTLKNPQSIWTGVLDTHHRDFIRLVYGSGHTDDCSCYCSVAGCTPISMALRIILGRPRKYYTGFGLSGKEKGFIFSQFILGIPSFAAAAHGILRFITFTDLGLTHTCCRFDYDRDGIKDFPFDEEEAVEIQDEEKHLLIDFEGLLEEIIREYDQLEIPLLEYIHTHWCRRVREYLWNSGETVDSHSLCNRLDPDFARQWDENKTYKPPKTTSSIPA